MAKTCLSREPAVLSKPVVPQPYALLNLTDLRLGLEDLLTVRLGPLLRTQAGKAHENILQQQRDAIRALPAPLTGGRPFAEELALRHSEVDGFGSGIWHLLEAYVRFPGVDPEIVAAVKRIRYALIPNTDRLRDAYPEQAAAAEVRRQNLATVVDDLKLIPIAGSGKTLFDWAEGFIQSGEQIATTLAERAEINATTRKRAMVLLADTVRILNELRTEVIAEIGQTIGMPRDTEDAIFGYFDVLESMRIEAKRVLDQNQALVGPVSTRGLTPLPMSTRIIPGPTPSNPGFPDGPPSTRVIPPPEETPIPLSRRAYTPPPSARGPKSD